MSVVDRTDGTDRIVQWNTYLEFPEELLCYDAEDEFVASIPREAVVAIETAAG